jgi:hypothetical protein
MEVPDEAVRTLSDTTWGAILILTVFVMGAAITYLAYMVRRLNSQLVDVSNKRTQDVKEDAAKAQEVVERALNTLNTATTTIDLLKGKVCTMTEEVTRLRNRVENCPHRGGNP